MTRNFKYLDDLIHRGENEIFLDSDIVLADMEESKYRYGIELDVDGLVINGNGYSIDAKSKTKIFECKSKDITPKKVTLKNIKFKNGFSQFGGAITNTKGKLSIISCIFESNMAMNGGGAIENKADTKISGCIFNENLVHNPKYSGGGAIINSGKLHISDSNFSRNYSEYEGIIDNWGDLKINNCNFKSHHASVIYNRSKISLLNSRFSDNHSQVHGGSIVNEKGNLAIKGCIFESNDAEWSGGALYAERGILEISDSTFNDNSSKSSGGVISNESRVQIQNCKFTSNKAPTGGAIDSRELFHKDVGLSIIGSSFESNQADYGGAIRDGTYNLTVWDSTFKNNLSKSEGGAIYAEHRLVAGRCSFESNTADKGGAIWMNFEWEGKLEDCTFKDNKPDDICDDIF